MRDDGQMAVCVCVCVCTRAVLLGDSHDGERVWGYTGGWSVKQQASLQPLQDPCTKTVQ